MPAATGREIIMSKFSGRSPYTYFGTLVFLFICGWALPAHSQTITWLDLPWPINQNWGGPEGSPATTNGNVITLTGQDVLSIQSFSGPVTISYNVTLTSETTSDGAFEFFFVPTGVASNTLPNPDVELQMGFNPGNVQAQTNHGAAIMFSSAYTINPPAVFSNVIAVAANGVVSWAINGQDLGLSNSVVMPYSSFQIRLSSWQPTQVWQVSDFTVTVPVAITCPNIIGTWTGQVNVADSWNGYRETPLSLQVTDQSTNGCLLRGYLNTGSAYNRAPWGCFSPGGLWGKVPFTGTILDTTGVVLNFGMFGQASATLDISQTPPVMTKFLLLSTGGAANGDTAVGELTEEPSTP